MRTSVCRGASVHEQHPDPGVLRASISRTASRCRQAGLRRPPCRAGHSGNMSCTGKISYSDHSREKSVYEDGKLHSVPSRLARQA